MDEWDSIDWDEKVKVIIKKKVQQQKQSEISESASKVPAFTSTENDGNYYEINEQKKKSTQRVNKAETSKYPRKSEEEFIQPYSYKDLARFCALTSDSTEFHNLIYETFGQFKKFILTHQQDLTQEAIVDLLKIDVSLIEVPFYAHNQLLLLELSKIRSFWSQLIEFVKDFLNHKHNDVRFLLAVDMNGFFDNIEYLIHNLLVNNFFNSEMELVLEEVITVLRKFDGNKWFTSDRLEVLQNEYTKNLNSFRTFNVNILNINYLRTIIIYFFEFRFTQHLKICSQYLKIFA